MSGVETELKRFGGSPTPLGTLLSAPLGNGRSVPDAKSGGPSFPVLRLTALRNGRVIVSEAKRGDWDRAKAAPYLVRRGDFLVARGNGSLDLVGRGGLSTEDAEVAFPDTMIRVRIDESRVLQGYLAIVWESARTRQYMRASARTTAGIYKVNQTHLAKLEVPVPPLADQELVIERVTRIMERTNRLGASVSLAIKRVEILRSAILASAFTGRLPAGTEVGQAVHMHEALVGA
jgi:type I restriction enzyme S subunit